MFTKSKIQQILEDREYKCNFLESLQNLMNKYTIEDSVFSYSGKLNEITNGYFEIDSEYSTIEEAIGNYKNGMGIRIINNESFQLGKLCKFISECDKEKSIMDINRYVNY